MTQQEIGLTVKERRRQLGINQQTLADSGGVSINTIVSIERGEGNPRLVTLLMVFDTLGLQMNVSIK